MILSFRDKLLPAPIDGGFSMKGYWIWGGSPIKGDDGLYYMFVSRWPNNLSFSPHWLTNSEVVMAISKTPEGPYAFEKVVLPPRGAEYWDGRMTHNPTIHKYGDTYLLYYTGSTYKEDTPAKDNPEKPDSPLVKEAHSNQRIGLATSKSLSGPWVRRDKPIVLPRPGKWDGFITTNPAPCVLPDGNILLIYKSVRYRGDLLRLGVTKSIHFEGPYNRLKDEPIFTFDDTGNHVEDPYVWYSNGHFELLMKDMEGGICGEKGGGIHAISKNGVDWTISKPSLAYSRTVLWNNGKTTKQGFLERPQLLIQDDKPTHLFLATADRLGEEITRAWNMVIPLR